MFTALKPVRAENNRGTLAHAVRTFQHGDAAVVVIHILFWHKTSFLSQLEYENIKQMFIYIFSAKCGTNAFCGKFSHKVDLLKFSDIIMIDIDFQGRFEKCVLSL
jgi:hypothetical protein